MMRDTPRHTLRAAMLLTLCSIALPGQAQEPDVRTTRDITDEERRDWAEDADRALDGVEPRLAIRVTWMLEELWDKGWPAQIASAHRTLEAQRASFEAGHSKTLRSKHLCGKAVDFNLRPHDYPHADHPYWDAKDALAHRQKLLTLDAPSFRDRPHVELDEDCDWDSVLLGPEGTWVHDDQTLHIAREPRSGYTGTLETATRTYTITRVRVSHRHSGERHKLEDASVRITLEAPDGKSHTRSYEVSTVTSPSHGYRRADWRWLRRSSTSPHLIRVSP